MDRLGPVSYGAKAVRRIVGGVPADRPASSSATGLARVTAGTVERKPLVPARGEAGSATGAPSETADRAGGRTGADWTAIGTWPGTARHCASSAWAAPSAPSIPITLLVTILRMTSPSQSFDPTEAPSLALPIPRPVDPPHLRFPAEMGRGLAAALRTTVAELSFHSAERIERKQEIARRSAILGDGEKAGTARPARFAPVAPGEAGKATQVGDPTG